MKAAPPRLIAHRGGAALAPENTLAACELAWLAGFRALEVDVKLSRDGLAFLLHDDTLDRTTAASGRASGMRWEDLCRACPGQVEPLAALAAWCADHPCWVNLELKTDADASVATQFDWGRRIAAAALALWPQRPPLLSSFSVAALQGARAAAPQLARAWLGHALPAGWLGLAQALGLQAIHLDAHAARSADIAAVHRAGLQLRLYTVNDAQTAASWLRQGVDAVFSDAWLALEPA